jgi:hypothetical protein
VNSIPNLSTGNTDTRACLRHTVPMWKGYVLHMMNDNDKKLEKMLDAITRCE